MTERAHLCIVQPRGYVHSLGLLDPALYLRHQLARLGVEATIGKNRLRGDAVNYVLGAHLGFDPAWLHEFRCVLVNLEQLGEGGAAVAPQYLRLLRAGAVVDYHPANVPAYRDADAAARGDVPILAFGYAPYLDPGADGVPLRERPIDLLFVGSMNERRAAVLGQIEATGVRVAQFDTPVYGPERDYLIRQAKAVVNVAFYETARFEQVRASLVLSCGTPLVSERRELASDAERAYADLTLWFDTTGVGAFFGDYFGGQGYLDAAEAALERFRGLEVIESVEAVWRYGLDRTDSPPSPLPAVRLNLDMDRTGYRPGWLNVDPNPRRCPDWVADLRSGYSLPVPLSTTRWGRMTLAAGHVQQIDAGPVDPRDPHLATLLATSLTLLAEGGVLLLEWPASGDPAILDRFTHRFWEGGGLGHRFEIHHAGALSAAGTPSGDEPPVTLRVVLHKTACSLWDSTVARAASEDFALAGADA